MELKELIFAARGLGVADLLLKNVRVVNVFSGGIVKGSVAILGDRVIGFGGYRAKRTIDLKGMYLSPGLIDGHIHIESTLLTPVEFARAVLPMGTTAVVADPHEIANVMGKRGISYMLDSCKNLPFDVFIMLPSCVPATNLETSWARLDAGDLRGFLKSRNVLGLAEVMNYHGVLEGEREVIRKIKVLGQRRVDGHSPGLSGRPLSAYISSGIASDHECTTRAEAREKLNSGMFVMIREGTIEKNLKELLPLVNERNSRRFMFVSDDIHPFDLEQGHLDSILRKAVKSGLDPVTALRLVTLNPSEYFGLRHLGAIGPGYKADLVVFKDLRNFKVFMTIKNGRIVARDGKVTSGIIKKRPSAVRDSVRIGWTKTKGIALRAEAKSIKVIKVVPGQILTRLISVKGRIEGGLVVSDTKRDILKAVVMERHRGTGRRGVAFVRGFGLRRGAIASSVAHDSHNVVAVGVKDEDIIKAVRTIERIKGGLVVVEEGKVLASLKLPVAGLISGRPLHEVAASAGALVKAARGLGCKLKDPFMTMSFLALPVIPEVRVTDMGLVDVEKGAFVSLFDE